MTNAPLRGCPTCGTKVDDVDLGLRDYRWLGDALPGRIAPMDMDFVLEKNGNFLVIEFKHPGQGLPMGQRLTLKALTRGPKTVETWAVWGDGPVEVGAMDRRGNVDLVSKMSVSKLRERVKAWFSWASEERG